MGDQQRNWLPAAARVGQRRKQRHLQSLVEWPRNRKERQRSIGSSASGLGLPRRIQSLSSWTAGVAISATCPAGGAVILLASPLRPCRNAY